MNIHATAGNIGEQVRSDCHVSLELREQGGIDISLQSKVEGMFGNQIRDQISSVLQQMGVEHARVEMEDSGALPFVISARLEAAVRQLNQTDLRVIPTPLPGLNPENSSERVPEKSRDHLRLSRLYLPGNTPSLMINAGIHRPDGIILDLEDSVAPDKKEEARILVRNALLQVDFYGAERMVRINQLPAGLKDLEEIVPHFVQLILIPKCEGPDEVQQVDETIRALLKEAGQERKIWLMPIIESALGVEHAFQIAVSSERVVALAIGLEDYTADLGVRRTQEGEESFYARTRIVNACKAAGIQPIDSVFSDVEDMEGLLVTAKRSRALGFEGMGCIHPRQIRVIHEGFCPDLEEIERAERIVEAFREAEKKGLGVTTLGSKMIDPPVVKRAQQVLQMAARFNQTAS
ncbi:MAG: aldolase/citrate lyase family protein [Bacteroidales bacterium]